MPFDSGWHSRNELARHRRWCRPSANGAPKPATSSPRSPPKSTSTACWPSPDPDLPDVRVRGRVDRLERDVAGRLVIVDIKTGKNPATKDDAQRHAQLALYQLAVVGRDGSVRRTTRRRSAGLPRQAGHRRTRPGRTDTDSENEWRQTVHRAAAATVGPAFIARINDSCSHCPVRASCPAQREQIMTPRYRPGELADALGLPTPTDEQAAVIAAPPGPLVVIAGAGAGKTETMAARVVWLVANGFADPGQVLGLTFTRKAPPSCCAASARGCRRLDRRGSEHRCRRHRAADGQHLPRVRRRSSARPRAAAARRARHPAAQRNGACGSWLFGLSATIPVISTPTRARQPSRRWCCGLSSALAEHLVDTAQLRDTHIELERLVHTLPAGPYQRDRGPSQWLLRLLAVQHERTQLVPLVDALHARMRADKVMDFGQQMAAAARLAVAHPEVGEQLRGRFRVVLLDEYQDTGHAQRIALSTLFGGGVDDGWRSPRSATRSNPSTGGAARRPPTCRGSPRTSHVQTARRRPPWNFAPVGVTRPARCIWPTPSRPTPVVARSWCAPCVRGPVRRPAPSAVRS